MKVRHVKPEKCLRVRVQTDLRVGLTRFGASDARVVDNNVHWFNRA